MKKNHHLKLAAILTLASSALALQANAQAVNVLLSRTTSTDPIVTTVNPTVTIAGGAADLADSGTTWNSLVCPTVASNNASGGNVTFTVEQNLSLVNSAGAASSISISSISFTENNGKTDTIHNAGETAGTDPGTDGLAANPSGLMGQSWFDNGTSEYITFNLSGLNAGSIYNLFIYGSGQNVGYGGTYTAAAANQAPGYNTATGAYTTEQDSASIYRSVFDSTGVDPVPENGLSWVLLPVQADGDGNLSFDVRKDNGSGLKGSINGFQLDPVAAVPEPGTMALFAAGMVLTAILFRRRKLQS